MPKVDVIITCYNKQDTIARAIKSVKQQTLKDFFCVVVDDGSTDDSWQIIETEIENDDRFIAVKLKNCGVGNARNHGASYGNSPYINCLDGDDGYYPEFLETLYNAISQDRTLGIVYTEVLLYHIDGNFTIADWSNVDHQKQFQGHNQIPCCNLFRRDVFERLGGYNQRYAPNGAGAEDAELWLRFFRLGYKAKKVTEQPLFVYSAFTGLTQQSDYEEVNWINWHNTKPAPSLQKPNNGIAHIINEYDRPEVSIIIPVGPNHIHYLRDALDSLEAQTFVNWECIVVFDIQYVYGKSPLSKELETAYPYVKWLFTDSKHGSVGAGHARNLGITHSNGQYIIPLDADDYLQPRFIELTLSALKHFKADWVYTDLYTQTVYNVEQYNLKVNELKSQGLFHKTIREKNDTVEFYYRYNCDEWNIEKLWTSGIAAVTGIYKREDFELVSGFDEKNNREDWDFHMRLAKAGKCGLRLPLPLFTYRLNTGIRREYKTVAKNADESKSLKQKDVERIHKTYNLEEFEMACTACAKKKINIKPTNENDLTTLVYIGKVTGGTVNGPVTRRPYNMQRRKDGTFTIQKVHPQDAEAFINRGTFKATAKPKKKSNVIVSPTPQKVEVVQLSREERLEAQNKKLMQIREESRRLVEQMFNTPKPLLEETTNKKPETDWYDTPKDYSISQLKNMIDREKPTIEQLETLYDNEAMRDKPRKTLLSYLIGKLK